MQWKAQDSLRDSIGRADQTYLLAYHDGNCGMIRNIYMYEEPCTDLSPPEITRSICTIAPFQYIQMFLALLWSRIDDQAALLPYVATIVISTISPP